MGSPDKFRGLRLVLNWYTLLSDDIYFVYKNINQDKHPMLGKLSYIKCSTCTLPNIGR